MRQPVAQQYSMQYSAADGGLSVQPCALWLQLQYTVVQGIHITLSHTALPAVLCLLHYRDNAAPFEPTSLHKLRNSMVTFHQEQQAAVADPSQYTAALVQQQQHQSALAWSMGNSPATWRTNYDASWIERSMHANTRQLQDIQTAVVAAPAPTPSQHT